MSGSRMFEHKYNCTFDLMSSVPAAMQVRYLQTLSELGSEHNSTIVFAMPLDSVRPFLDILSKDAASQPAVVAASNGAKLPAL